MEKNTNAAPTNVAGQTPVNTNLNETTNQPTTVAPKTTEVAPAPKKKHTGLIIGIIVAVLLLVGGGAFAAFAIIRNQPENIAAEAFSNLINAKQAAVSGTITFTPKGDYADVVGPINVTLNSGTANSNFSSAVSLSAKYGDYQKNIELEVGEVLLNNGVFYLKANGIKKIYDEFLSDMLVESLGSQTASTVAAIEDRIESIIRKVDDQWFEFSIKDILENEMVSAYIDDDNKETINKAYNCTMQIYNNISKYSSEISDLYSKNKFITLEPAENSFYKVSFDSSNLANYINSIPNTKIVADYASCNDFEITEEMYSPVSSTDISRTLTEMPNIYTKYEGFLNHRLTEVKIEKDDEYYTLSSDMNISYPANLTVSAPTDARPIMDVVQDIIEELTEFSQSL